MDDNTQATEQAYDRFPEEFERKYLKQFEKCGRAQVDRFLMHVCGKQLLDLGSGPGFHAEYFASRGMDVVCVDISEALVRRCRAKGLNAKRMDMEELTFPSASFDAIWANASFLHIPKVRIQALVQKIKDVLRPGGVISVSVKDGEGERSIPMDQDPELKRFFSFFHDDEFRAFFAKDFEIVDFFRSEDPSVSTFLFYMFRVKPPV